MIIATVIFLVAIFFFIGAGVVQDLRLEYKYRNQKPLIDREQ